MKRVEANFDGLVGATHNYAGLSFGNVASETHAGAASRPRAAALQGLAKMKLLHELGVPQFVLPPHPRPNLPWLKRVGYARIEDVDAALLPVAYSASGMWAANAATVCGSADALDGKVHFTPANLINGAHRALEAEFTAPLLARLFPGDRFVHHAPLPANPLLADEGAANHMRLSRADGSGIQVFVYGREGAEKPTMRYPARHSLAASQAIARLHDIPDGGMVFVRQSPEAIDAGVFHNDVISTANGNLLLYHEQAFADGDAPVDDLRARMQGELIALKITAAQLPLSAAVSTYLFNSQVVTLPGGSMALIAPAECAAHPAARALVESWLADADNPVAQAHFLNLRESMRNGGGSACLRLRVPLTEAELAQVHPGVRLSDTLYGYLVEWVEANHRESLSPEELRDPSFAREALNALSALERILDLPGLYDGYR